MTNNKNTNPQNDVMVGEGVGFERIRRGVGDHFTTLYMYVEDRREGRRLAKVWQNWLETHASVFWTLAKQKAAILYLANLLHLSLSHYHQLKDIYLGRK